jgi:hypothetical protein
VLTLLAIAAVGVSTGLFIIAGFLYVRQNRTFERASVARVLDAKWADQVSGLIVDKKLGVTGETDMSALQTQCDLEDIEEAFLNGTAKIVRDVTAHLLDESKWVRPMATP